MGTQTGIARSWVSWDRTAYLLYAMQALQIHGRLNQLPKCLSVRCSPAEQRSTVNNKFLQISYMTNGAHYIRNFFHCSRLSMHIRAKANTRVFCLSTIAAREYSCLLR